MAVSGKVESLVRPVFVTAKMNPYLLGPVDVLGQDGQTRQKMAAGLWGFGKMRRNRDCPVCRGVLCGEGTSQKRDGKRVGFNGLKMIHAGLAGVAASGRLCVPPGFFGGI